MRDEQRARQSTKAGDQHQSVSDTCRRRIVELPFVPRRLKSTAITERWCFGFTVATKLSRIGPGTQFEVLRVAKFQPVSVERHRK